jgi:hypothetical protein
MHELKVDEGMTLKTDQLEFKLAGIWKMDNGELTASIHSPKHSKLWEEMGERFEACVGDTFEIAGSIYKIEKIVEGKHLPDGKYENGHIVIIKE